MQAHQLLLLAAISSTAFANQEPSERSTLDVPKPVDLVELPGGGARPRDTVFHDARERALEGSPHATHCPISVLVQFEGDCDEVRRREIRDLVGGCVVRRYTIVRDLEHIWTTCSSEDAVRLLEGVDGVELVSLDHVGRNGGLSGQPNPDQWGLHNTGSRAHGSPYEGRYDVDVDAPEAWLISSGAGETVAIFDSGLQTNHPDLAANVWINVLDPINGIDDDSNGYVDDRFGWNFWNNNANVEDSHGHGTQAAGVVGAVNTNNFGVAGVAPSSRLLPVKIANGVTSSSIDTTFTAMLDGYEYVITNTPGATVCVEWWFDLFPAGVALQLQSLQALIANDSVFVCIAGNQGQDLETMPLHPAASGHPLQLTAGASDAFGNFSTFSNWSTTHVHVSAPGVNIRTTTKDGGYTTVSGTSFSAPHVAGVAALVRAANPTWTVQQVVSTLRAATKPLPSHVGRTASGGVVSAALALGSTAHSPRVAILSPRHRDEFEPGERVRFAADALDDVPISGSSIVWTSNLSGHLGTGASIAVDGLAPGVHTIEAVVGPDATGLIGRTSLSILVDAPSQDVIRVSPAGSVSGNGSTWATAISPLLAQFLMGTNASNAPNGVEYWFSEGTYAMSFNPGPNIRVYGGFDGTELSKRARNPEKNPTIFAGGLLNSNGWVLGDGYILTGFDPIIDGVVFSMSVDLSPFSPGVLFRNCRFQGGSGQANGFGSVQSRSANVRFVNCDFRSNTAIRGAAFADLGSLQGKERGVASFERCTFSQNDSLPSGSAVTSLDSSLSIEHCTFTDNDTAGGAVVEGERSVIDVRRSIVWGNAATPFHFDGATTITVEECNVQGGWSSAGSANYDAHPLFVGAAVRDYRPSFGSPSVDQHPVLATTMDRFGIVGPTDGDLDTAPFADTGAHELGLLTVRGVPRIGSSVELETFGPLGGVAAVFMSPGYPLAIPVSTPFGAQWIDATAVTLLALRPTAPAPPAVLTLNVPNEPALIGAVATLQAAIGPVGPPSTIVASNAVTITLR